ncbi:hypothetical protein ABBQ32_007675 [Trebouxia sp. C0010 RCD-2024]
MQMIITLCTSTVCAAASSAATLAHADSLPKQQSPASCVNPPKPRAAANTALDSDHRPVAKGPRLSTAGKAASVSCGNPSCGAAKTANKLPGLQDPLLQQSWQLSACSPN